MTSSRIGAASVGASREHLRLQSRYRGNADHCCRGGDAVSDDAQGYEALSCLSHRRCSLCGTRGTGWIIERISGRSLHVDGIVDVIARHALGCAIVLFVVATTALLVGAARLHIKGTCCEAGPAFSGGKAVMLPAHLCEIAFRSDAQLQSETL